MNTTTPMTIPIINRGITVLIMITIDSGKLFDDCVVIEDGIVVPLFMHLEDPEREDMFKGQGIQVDELLAPVIFE